MTDQAISDRKQYVESIRQSFQRQPGEEEAEEYGDFSESPVSFFKIHLFLAFCLFLAFVVCDQMHYKIYTYSTKEVLSLIEAQPFEKQCDKVIQELTELLD